MKNTILFLGILIILTHSCKKYEDGPFISLRSPINRLLGEWEVYSFEIDGSDFTSDYQNNCKCNFRFHSEKYDAVYFSFLQCKDDYSIGGRFEFNGDILKIETGNAYNTNNLRDSLIYTGPIKTWAKINCCIKRLYFKDLWLSSYFNNRKYFIKLKKGGENEE